MFIPITQKDREEMLRTIGVKSFDELIKQVPEKIRNPRINMGSAMNEMELMGHVRALASKNMNMLNFAGGGAYDHFIPAGVKALACRGEFLSAYTPYQAEASQGTLQAIYEFQSLICSLFSMDAANASMYDAATA